MCFLVGLQEGKHRNLTAVSDSFSTDADINSTVICGSEGMSLDSLCVLESLSSIQVMTEVHCKSALSKDKMIHKMLRIVDFSALSANVVLPMIRFQRETNCSLPHIQK